VKHRDIDYGIEEVEPSKWLWRIYPKIESGHPKVISEDRFPSMDAATADCIREINDGLDGKNSAPES
jgi:hypothetical protein